MYMSEMFPVKPSVVKIAVLYADRAHCRPGKVLCVGTVSVRYEISSYRATITWAIISEVVDLPSLGSPASAAEPLGLDASAAIP